MTHLASVSFSRFQAFHSRSPKATSVAEALAGMALLLATVNPAVSQTVTPALVVEDRQIDAETLPTETKIDRYVNEPDASYKWKIVNQVNTPGGSYVSVRFTSQTWLTKAEVDKPQWEHRLELMIPSKPASNVALLWIGGGSRNGLHEIRSAPPQKLVQLAAASNSVVAELSMVPNQPLVFHGDGVERKEDDLIGYTWDQFLKTGKARWLARNAMVKSAVRAMDTVTAVTDEVAMHKIEEFVVAGASKRGWTTWLTGAMDERVVGIVPIVIDVLNTNESMRHHFAAYGYWAPAVGNYVQHHVMERMDDPRTKELYQLVDPYYYRHRLRMPKLILNASGDQFFLPDSSQFYWDDLQGPKCLRYVPNADHSLDGTDALSTLAAFYNRLLQGKDLPDLRWSVEDGLLIARSSEAPKMVKAYAATNPTNRDFRLETLGPEYISSVVSALPNGSYCMPLRKPQKGWAAAFLEFTYEDESSSTPLKLTTSVYVTPDILPFADRPPTANPSVTVKAIFADTDRATRVLEKAKILFPSSVSSTDLATEQDEETIYLNWVGEEPAREIGQVMEWLEQQKASQVQLQLEAGRHITTTAPEPALK